jgi:TP901-1 family phage major tail protein
MSVQRGRDLLVKIQNPDGGQFTSVAGVRSHDISLNARPIETTHADSSGRWRELLGQSGVRSARINGTGLMVSSQTDRLWRNIFFNGDLAQYQIFIPGLCLLAGPFALTQMQYSGAYDGELSWRVELVSGGALNVSAL